MITSVAEQASGALTSRLALVTGAGGGLGHAIARGLAEAGAEVIVHGRDRARLAAKPTFYEGAKGSKHLSRRALRF